MSGGNIGSGLMEGLAQGGIGALQGGIGVVPGMQAMANAMPTLAMGAAQGNMWNAAGLAAQQTLNDPSFANIGQIGNIGQANKYMGGRWGQQYQPMTDRQRNAGYSMKDFMSRGPDGSYDFDEERFLRVVPNAQNVLKDFYSDGIDEKTGKKKKILNREALFNSRFNPYIKEDQERQREETKNKAYQLQRRMAENYGDIYKPKPKRDIKDIRSFGSAENAERLHQERLYRQQQGVMPPSVQDIEKVLSQDDVLLDTKAGEAMPAGRMRRRMYRTPRPGADKGTIYPNARFKRPPEAPKAPPAPGDELYKKPLDKDGKPIESDFNLLDIGGPDLPIDHGPMTKQGEGAMEGTQAQRDEHARRIGERVVGFDDLIPSREGVEHPLTVEGSNALEMQRQDMNRALYRAINAEEIEPGRRTNQPLIGVSERNRREGLHPDDMDVLQAQKQDRENREYAAKNPPPPMPVPHRTGDQERRELIEIINEQKRARRLAAQRAKGPAAPIPAPAPAPAPPAARVQRPRKAMTQAELDASFGQPYVPFVDRPAANLTNTDMPPVNLDQLRAEAAARQRARDAGRVAPAAMSLKGTPDVMMAIPDEPVREDVGSAELGEARRPNLRYAREIFGSPESITHDSTPYGTTYDVGRATGAPAVPPNYRPEAVAVDRGARIRVGDRIGGDTADFRTGVAEDYSGRRRAPYSQQRASTVQEEYRRRNTLPPIQQRLNDQIEQRRTARGEVPGFTKASFNDRLKQIQGENPVPSINPKVGYRERISTVPQPPKENVPVRRWADLPKEEQAKRFSRPEGIPEQRIERGGAARIEPRTSRFKRKSVGRHIREGQNTINDLLARGDYVEAARELELLRERARGNG
jgi:hypothetical protein